MNSIFGKEEPRADDHVHNRDRRQTRYHEGDGPSPEQRSFQDNRCEHGDKIARCDEYDRAETREEARALLRVLIAHRLGGQTLHTRAVLMELQEL